MLGVLLLLLFHFPSVAISLRASIRLRRSREVVWADGLPLHEVADHLLAVAARAPIADVYPLGLALGGGLPDELVKREVVHHPGEPLAARLDVGDKDVGSDCESPKEGSGKVKT